MRVVVRLGRTENYCSDCREGRLAVVHKTDTLLLPAQPSSLYYIRGTESVNRQHVFLLVRYEPSTQLDGRRSILPA